MKMMEWVKIPTDWILDKEDPVLRKFRWHGPEKSGYVAALMVYVAVAHNVISSPSRHLQEAGMAILTFNDLIRITDLSRAKIAEAIRILESFSLMERVRLSKTNTYKIVGYNPDRSWAKLPARTMYDKTLTSITSFSHFKLRQKNELNALKIYFLLVAFRDRKTNHAKPAYGTITNYTGVQGGDIRAALSLLVNLNMVHVDKSQTFLEPEKTCNMYRIVGIDNHKHRGTMTSDQISGVRDISFDTKIVF